MKFDLLKKDSKDAQIGLDIGGSYVKAVAIAYFGDSPKLIAYSIKKVGDNIVQAIKDAHAELGLTETRVVSSLSGQTVIVRYIELPSMTEDELKNAAKFEAEKIIPYNINEVEIDAAKIENLEGNRMRVVIAAVKKDLVDSQLKILSEAGLTPNALDIDSFALMRSFVNTAIDTENISALLNIGDKKTNLNIVKGGKTYLSRDLDIGGYSISKAIADNLGVKIDEASKIAQEKLSKFSSISEDERKVVEAPLIEALSHLLDGVRLSFDFFENHYGESISKTYISGGLAIAKVVEDFLKENIGRDLNRWDPLINIEVSDNVDQEKLKVVSTQLAVAIGLGLRRAE